MGGEMIFTHNDKPIEDLEAYKKILKEIEKDCATLTEAKTGVDICLITNPISNWKNGYITRYGRTTGQDEDYELSVDLRPGRNPENHYYVLFPRDPNTLKVLSNTHDRGMNGYNRKWIHYYFVKFVTTFPGVFELFYGDAEEVFYGVDNGCIYFRDGSDVPVRRTCPEIMSFSHNDKPIKDLEAYKKILKEIENDCATLTQAKTGVNICLITNPISNWKNGYIPRHYGDAMQDDDYELSVDLGSSDVNPEHYDYECYYVIFPRDPNTFKIYSHLNAKKMSECNKMWIHDYFIKFVTTFPGVFELYYNDASEILYGVHDEIVYRDGSDVPVRLDWTHGYQFARANYKRF